MLPVMVMRMFVWLKDISWVDLLCAVLTVPVSVPVLPPGLPPFMPQEKRLNIAAERSAADTAVFNLFLIFVILICPGAALHRKCRAV